MTPQYANARPLVGIMAKAPRAGHAKTRLTAALPPAVAADLYAHFLRDTVDLVSRVPGVAATLLCPPGDAAALRAMDLGLPVLEQPEPGLMRGLAFGIAHGLEVGHPAVALINADSPTLPPERIAACLAALADAEVVLGPTADGGYYLIGATVSCTDLLLGVSYSSSHTIYQETLAQAEQLGLRARAIAPWWDVDLPDELAQLARALDAAPPHTAVHTRRALIQHAALIAAL